jgi:hypothetical protein
MSLMIQRTGRGGTPEYWSRLGWSDFYAMPLDANVAEQMCEGWKAQFPHADVKVVPHQKFTAQNRPKLGNYTR